MVPFLDLQAINERSSAAFMDALQSVINSGQFINGPHVRKFEESFASYCGAAHCVGVGNGLDALILILRGLGIGPGHEVIVPANTFIASFLAISAVGATPVPVDVDKKTLLMTAETAATGVSEKTKAIMPVHLFGHACEMDSLKLLAKDKGIFLVEDAAQAHGAKDSKGRLVGSVGDAAAFSFYPGKNLGALGDGGAVITNSNELSDKISTLRNYGARVKYNHSEKGVNSRLDEVQAAFLNVRLSQLGEDNAWRQRVAEQYMNHISSPHVRLPWVVDGSTSVWHLFPVRVMNRNGFMDHMKSLEIDTLIHYPICCHKQECYAELSHITCPVAEEAAQQLVSIPISPVITDAQVERVVDAINIWQG